MEEIPGNSHAGWCVLILASQKKQIKTGTLLSGEDKMAPSCARLGVGLLSMLKRPGVGRSFLYSPLKHRKVDDESVVGRWTS